MLLAIDIGNTNIVWGVFDGAKLLADWRVSTDHSKTTDEYAILLLDLLRVKEIRPDRVAGVVLASVLAPAAPGFGGLCGACLHLPPFTAAPNLGRWPPVHTLHP